jgi:hypothetical protein
MRDGCKKRKDEVEKLKGELAAKEEEMKSIK